MPSTVSFLNLLNSVMVHFHNIPLIQSVTAGYNIKFRKIVKTVFNLQELFKVYFPLKIERRVCFCLKRWFLKLIFILFHTLTFKKCVFPCWKYQFFAYSTFSSLKLGMCILFPWKWWFFKVNFQILIIFLH